MKKSSSLYNLLNKLSIGIHVFIGVGGFFGGLSAVMNPLSPLGISTDALKIGPFTDFLIPGLFLMIVIGAGNFFAAFASFKKCKYHDIVTGLTGALLLGWIVIQCLVLQAVATLHIIFFCLGALQGIMATISLYRENIFPMNIVRKWIDKKTGLNPGGLEF